MTTLDENEALEAGEWGVIITRVAQAIRRECGEATANRVVTLLHEQKREAIDAMRAQIESANATLETTLSEVADARRAHERLQLDLSRMEAAVREARTEAAAIRAKASSEAVEAKGAIAATAEAEAERLAEAWERVREHEGQVAARRAELIDLEEQADSRLAAVGDAERELGELRAVIEAERLEAQRLVDEAITTIDERESAADDGPADPEIDLRDDEIDLRDGEFDLREQTLRDREAELVEWEAELVRRSQDLEQRRTTPTLPPPGPNIAGWGSRRTN